MMNGNAQNYNDEVIVKSKSIPVLVDFWAPWCPPCKALGPILEKLAESNQDKFQLIKVNTDEESDISGGYGIRSIPTCILFKDGQEVERFVGLFNEKQVAQFLEKNQILTV